MAKTNWKAGDIVNLGYVCEGHRTKTDYVLRYRYGTLRTQTITGRGNAMGCSCRDNWILKNKVTTGGDMEISEMRVSSAEELEKGWTVRVTKTTDGYNKEQLGRVYARYDESQCKKDDTNYMRYIKIGSVDDETKNVGGWTHVDNIVLVQQTKKGFIKTTHQQFDITHLDKVILPDGHKRAILETLTQEHENNRDILFNQWGFGSVFEKGKGIIFLFYGVPGTGKTLAAEKIAMYLKKDHLVMSTADIQSSVPGQAERNIKKMFDQAKKGKHLIVIDECDALLYDRNSVGMIMAAEINCLLGEIEKFDGVCIMTTNRNHKLDPALERRIALKLEFPKPNAELRNRIWKTLIPKKCPLERDVEIGRLSEYSICGGNIKNVIFSAARKALHEKRKKVRMDDFIVSIEREVTGQQAFKEGRGRVVRTQDMGMTSDVQKTGGTVEIFKEKINVEDKSTEAESTE